MAMSVVYGNFCGALAGENRGGIRSDYVADALGSVAVVVDDTGAAIYEAEYWPYGEARTEAGSNPSNWGFGGIKGYYTDLASNLLYVTKRHLTPFIARWLTVDGLWPMVDAFAYCGGKPTACMDPSGPFAECVACGLCVGVAALAALLGCINDSRGFLCCL